MSRKYRTSGLSIKLAMIAVLCLLASPAMSDTISMNVFERFRQEMAIDRNAAAVKFMTPEALVKWSSSVLHHFNPKHGQLRHFFALSMQVPKVRGPDIIVLYFNPWIDGALLTRWRQTGNDWKMTDFYFASGERLRGELPLQFDIPPDQITPAWLRYKGIFLTNIAAYYGHMRTRLMDQTFDQVLPWFALSSQERDSVLFRIKLRMGLRKDMSDKYKAHPQSGRVLSGAFRQLVTDALSKNTPSLMRYSRQGDLIAGLRLDILTTLKANWIFTKGNIYSAVMNSAMMPRMFIFLNITTDGRIETALLGDLEAMARQPAPPAAAAAASPAPPTRKVQRYQDRNGNQVEVITEKKDGKVTMTTRVNGAVTEVVNF